MPLRLTLTVAAVLTMLGTAAVLWLTWAPLPPLALSLPIRAVEPAPPLQLAVSPPVTRAASPGAPGPEDAPPVAAAAVLPAPVPAPPGVYDDSHLYRGEPVRSGSPPTAQGVLEAFGRNAAATQVCLNAHRRTWPHATSLQTVEVRLASQDNGVAQVEEVRLPGQAEPDLQLAGCLVRALSAEGFTVPPGGHVRLSQTIDLSSPASPSP